MLNWSRISLAQVRSVLGQQNHLRGVTRCYAGIPDEMETDDSNPKKRMVYAGEKGINKVTLLGRAGGDSELRGTDNHPVVTFSLATNNHYSSSTGEVSSVTEWHRIAVFRKGVRDMVLERVKKGSRVYVSGALKYSLYQGRDGNTQRGSNIIADDVICFSGKPEDTSDQSHD